MRYFLTRRDASCGSMPNSVIERNHVAYSVAEDVATTASATSDVQKNSNVAAASDANVDGQLSNVAKLARQAQDLLAAFEKAFDATTRMSTKKDLQMKYYKTCSRAKDFDVVGRCDSCSRWTGLFYGYSRSRGDWEPVIALCGSCGGHPQHPESDSEESDVERAEPGALQPTASRHNDGKSNQRKAQTHAKKRARPVMASCDSKENATKRKKSSAADDQ